MYVCMIYFADPSQFRELLGKFPTLGCAWHFFVSLSTRAAQQGRLASCCEGYSLLLKTTAETENSGQINEFMVPTRFFPRVAECYHPCYLETTEPFIRGTSISGIIQVPMRICHPEFPLSIPELPNTPS